MPWPENPPDDAYINIGFIQKDWMSEFSDYVGNTPMTSPGVCMALTTQLFEYRKNSRSPPDFFKWVRSNDGAQAIMKIQTAYMMSALGTTDPNAQVNMSFGSVLGAFRRSAEDDMYKSSGFESVDSPFFPSIFGGFGSLAKDVVQRHGTAGCLYKPIYMAKLGGGSHTIGAIVNFDRNNYAFFDSNHGYVAFQQLSSLESFVASVQDEYIEDFTAYFIDSKS
ncbi:YopT-type cysteine protease domain-containing protein [Roseomonas sp. CAU 1739]|uniref:YopT-type cysteine protease domain-containing protein n=1 Tax=Roseomonas sp. CAU 1739 TaxID=3140364 RepID=UPI00325AC14D